MPISVMWDNAHQTIIYVRYESWSWDDFYKAIKEVADLGATVHHPIDVIAHLMDNTVPKGSVFSHSGAALKQNDDKLGIIVVVTSNRFTLSLMQLSSRIVPGWQKKYRVSNTLETARELIARERQKKIGV